MGKRITFTVLLCVLVLVGVKGIKVDAATIKSPYLIEQAQGKAPNIKVYMTGSKMKESVPVSGTLGELTFAQDGEILPYKKSGEGISYIILFDNSG